MINSNEIDSRRFEAGLELLAEGSGFSFCNIQFFRNTPERVLDVCADASDISSLSDESARQLFDKSQSVFEHLGRESEEFARLVSGYKPRVSISIFDGMAETEVCFLENDSIIWC